MAKVDVNVIEGYQDMTPEEKIAALEAFEYEVPAQNNNIDLERLKNAVSRANSEAADYKRQLKAKMSEEEQKEAERIAAEKALQEELETLRKEKTVSTLRAEYVSLGYDAESATKAAQAKVDGDSQTELEIMKAFLEAQKQAAIKQALEGTPRPPAGNPDGALITKEQFDKMGYTERLKLLNEQPELYKQFTGGTE